MLFNIHTLAVGRGPAEAAGRAGQHAARGAVVERGLRRRRRRRSASANVPIAGIAGDQQAALFGQMCVSPGLTKNTYGTGCFLLQNTGETPGRLAQPPALDRRLAGRRQDRRTRSRAASSSAAPWCSGCATASGLIRDVVRRRGARARPSRTAAASTSCPPSPASARRTGTPYARGTIVGITRGTTAGHIARAALESIAFQVADLLEAMRRRRRRSTLTELRVDGGAARQRRAAAVPGRSARRAGRAAQGHRDDGARRGVPGRARGRLLGLDRRARAALAGRPALRAVSMPPADGRGAPCRMARGARADRRTGSRKGD